eukprot:scaffold731_cov261-Pinguiococcus_pyrenoidosus.AAC.98
MAASETPTSASDWSGAAYPTRKRRLWAMVGTIALAEQFLPIALIYTSMFFILTPPLGILACSLCPPLQLRVASVTHATSLLLPQRPAGSMATPRIALVLALCLSAWCAVVWSLLLQSSAELMNRDFGEHDGTPGTPHTASHSLASSSPAFARRQSRSWSMLFSTGKSKVGVLLRLQEAGEGVDAKADPSYPAEKIEQLFRDVEAANPLPNSLTSPKLNGDWRLVWTTSMSIAGKSRPKAFRPSSVTPRSSPANWKWRAAERRPEHTDVGFPAGSDSVSEQPRPQREKFGADPAAGQELPASH